jgi:hypothetical protein
MVERLDEIIKQLKTPSPSLGREEKDGGPGMASRAPDAAPISPKMEFPLAGSRLRGLRRLFNNFTGGIFQNYPDKYHK